jgi:hypothetical protein
MNISKQIITDLIPLYAANECSADTRALVEEYLRGNPKEAAELQRIISTPIPRGAPAVKDLGEAQAFREARRRLRLRSWLMGLALFFSLTPFSCVSTDNFSWWMLRDAPGAAAAYGMLGVVLWIIYGVQRSRARSL